MTEIKKNALETIRLEETGYEGVHLIDVRIWIEGSGGEMVPTKKGLALRPETWKEVLPLVEGILEGENENN